MDLSIGIISDVHGNLAALEAALAFLDAEGVEDVICCGDVVGYGPWPNECVSAVGARCGCCVSGNHDGAAAGEVELSHFNGDAEVALRWTRSQLSQASLDFLQDRPLKTPYRGFFVTHGSPRDPIWEYLHDRWGASTNFQHFDEHVCWFGHTHVPMVFKENGGDVRGGPVRDGFRFQLAPRERYLINPGSVGQPRDGDWRLSLAVYQQRQGEAASVSFHRLEYDLARVQRRMREANLPASLYNRLEAGR